MATVVCKEDLQSSTTPLRSSHAKRWKISMHKLKQLYSLPGWACLSLERQCMPHHCCSCEYPMVMIREEVLQIAPVRMGIRQAEHQNDEADRGALEHCTHKHASL